MTATAALLRARESAPSGGWYAANPRRQWRLVLVLLAVSSLGAVDRQVITLLVDPIRDALRLSDVQISLVVGAAFALSNTLFTLPAGYCADRISRRGLIACGVIVWSSFTMACGVASSLARLFLCRVGVGFGESVIQPCALSMLRAALSPERRGRGFAVQAMGAMGGSALALMVGGLAMGAIERAGLDNLPLVGPVKPWQATLIFVGLPGLLIPLLLVAIREPPHGVRIGAGPGADLRRALRLFLSRSSVYVPLLAYQLAMTMLSLGYAAWIAATVGRTWHLSYAQIGTRVGLLMLFLPPLGLWTVGHLMDRAAARMGLRGPVVVGLAATVLVGLAATAAPLAPTLGSFWFCLAGLFLVSGTVFPINATVTASITPAENMGSISGLQFFLIGLVAAGIGPTLVAVVSETLFSGPRSLADALSVTSCVFALTAFAALARVCRTIIPR